MGIEAYRQAVDKILKKTISRGVEKNGDVETWGGKMVQTMSEDSGVEFRQKETPEKVIFYQILDNGKKEKIITVIKVFDGVQPGERGGTWSGIRVNDDEYNADVCAPFRIALNKEENYIHVDKIKKEKGIKRGGGQPLSSTA